MSTVTAGDIVTKAAITLFDDTNVRWDIPELLKYLSDGQRQLVALNPSANPVNDVIALVSGTRQSIPAAGTKLIDIVRNMGTSGSTPGRAIREVPRKTIDATRPDWHTESAAAEVIHFMFDDRDPKRFYVTPPQPSSGQGQIEIIYAAAPVELTDVDDLIEVDDVWSPVLGFYVMARALAKQSGDGDPGGAAGYYQLFISGVTGEYEVDKMLHPLQQTDKLRR